MNYTLFTWPDSQDFMEKEWFQDEAILAHETKFGSQAYLIPDHRLDKKEFLLIKLDLNYGDEFDTESLWLTTLKEYEEFLDILEEFKNNITEYREIYFGTNEFIYFDSYEHVLDSLTTTLLTEQEYNILLKHIGKSYGLINIEYLVENFAD